MATARSTALATDAAISGKRVQSDIEDALVPKMPKYETNIHILKGKISSKRLNHLKQLAKKNNIGVCEEFTESVTTHIVSNFQTYDKILTSLNKDTIPANIEVVSLDWLTDTFIEGTLVQVTDRYRIAKARSTASSDVQTQSFVDHMQSKSIITEYECQRPTLLQHPNQHITDALELLERYCLLSDYEEGDTKALAFRQASCSIKALPNKVMYTNEVLQLHRIGKHSMRVIEEIVENGFSTEIEDVRNSEWFKCMELFTSVYGCGPATADKWYNKEG